MSYLFFPHNPTQSADSGESPSLVTHGSHIYYGLSDFTQDSETRV